MPKYVFQWKDPDYYDGEELLRSASDKERKKIRSLGAQEYLVVEFDTDAMTATVRK